MFINDDGLQLIDEDERRARIDFYSDHSIGWTARPKHGVAGFLRRGKFKKVLATSSRVPYHFRYFERVDLFSSARSGFHRDVYELKFTEC